MIVETLMKDMAWGPNGVTCPDEATGKEIYKFLYEAVLDSHIYVTKSIGFSVQNETAHNRLGTYIARNSQIGESYTEMMNNIQDKIFLNTAEPVIKVRGTRGILDCSAIETPILYTKNYLCRVLDGTVTLHLKLCTNCGYMTMEHTSKQLDSKFFPMNTYFNLSDYVRIIPETDNHKQTQIRYYNGMDVEKFKGILNRYMGMIQQEFISEEEAKWVYSFTL